MPPGCQVMISYRVPETGPPSKGGDGFSVQLRDGLVNAGYTVFLDRDNLKGGDQFGRIIQAGVEDCVAFIAVCSPSYAGDESLWTRSEFMYAIGLKKNILPIYHSGAWPPKYLGLFLSAINYVPKGRSVTTPGVTVSEVVAEAVASLHKMQVMPVAAKVPVAAPQDPESSAWGDVNCTESSKAMLRNNGITPSVAIRMVDVLGFSEVQALKLAAPAAVVSATVPPEALAARQKPEVLLQAAREGSVAEVERLLKLGVDCNWRSADGDTALRGAAVFGYCDVVKLLLASGASVDLRSPDGDSALTYAAFFGRLEVVKLLMAKGVNVNHVSTKTGESALQLAAQQGKVDVVQLLITSGATVDLPDKTGDTALIAAANSGHCDVVKLLLASGASVDLRAKNGATAVFMAAFKGYMAVVKVLKSSGADMELVSNDKVRAFLKSMTSSDGTKA